MNRTPAVTFTVKEATIGKVEVIVTRSVSPEARS